MIPAYNETQAIGKVLEEIAHEYPNCEVIVVDDGSTDDTPDIAAASGARLIKHQRNLGYTAAMVNGIVAATGDIIVTMNGDYTYPAAYIPKLVGLVNSGYEMAIGKRMAGPGNMPLFNRLGNRIFSNLISLLGGSTVSDVQSGLRAFRKSLFEELGVGGRNFEFETEITAKAILIGCRIAETSIEYRPRIGKSKLHPIRDGYGMFRAIFRFIRDAFSPTIKFLFLLPGFVSLAAAVILAISTLAYYLAGELPMQQVFPVLAVVFTIGGIQLTGAGIVFNVILARTQRAQRESQRSKAI